MTERGFYRVGHDVPSPQSDAIGKALFSTNQGNAQPLRRQLDKHEHGGTVRHRTLLGN